MAQFTATSDTYLHADGIREELHNMITDISPEETPLMSNIGSGSVSNTYFEWLTDALAAASTTNSALEGDDLTSYTDGTARIRLGNYTQISRKTVIVSGTQRAVDNAGVADELAYNVAKMGRELKRDVEATLCSEQAANAGGPTTARATAGFEAFIRTNVSKSSTGSTNPTLSGSTSGYPNAGPVLGTLRAVAEQQIKDVAQYIWTEGGNPSNCMVLMGPTIKTKMSAFTGIAQIRKDVPGATPATVIGAVEVYVTDFGTLTFTPSRFLRKAASGANEGSVLFVDPNYASIAYLQPFYVKDLAATGLSDKKVLAVEWGVKLGTEKAHGIIRDLNPAA